MSDTTTPAPTSTAPTAPTGLASALADAQAYVKQHPEYEAAVQGVKAATEELERVTLKLTEHALLVLIGDVPVVGSLAVALATPALDAAEAKAETAAVAATEAEAAKF